MALPKYSLGIEASVVCRLLVGIIGTYPGSSCGTQPLESFHSYWQGRVRAKARAQPTEIFAVMQDLYKDDWSDKFGWQDNLLS